MVESKDQLGTKDRIRRVAAELFAKNGYHATGIAELSDAVQLGRGALYHHIGNKEAVLYEISKEQIEQLVHDARLVMETSDSPLEKLSVMARNLMVNIAWHTAEWTVFFREFSALTGERREEVFRAREAYEGMWRTLLQEGADAGLFEVVDAIVVKGILGMFNYSYLWFDPKGGLTPEEIADRFTRLLLDGIAVAPRRSAVRTKAVAPQARRPSAKG
jgi:AcrR family transcriptional regulator